MTCETSLTKVGLGLDCFVIGVNLMQVEKCLFCLRDNWNMSDLRDNLGHVAVLKVDGKNASCLFCEALCAAH